MAKARVLNERHDMIGGLFKPLESEEERARYALPDDQVDAYRRHGFVRGPKVLDERQIEVLRERLERIRRGENPLMDALYEVDDAWKTAPDKNVFHFLGAWRIDDAFHDLIFHPRITIPVSQLLDSPRVRFWHDQVFYKPARHPGVVAWHQDYSYWTRSYPPRHLTVWIGLDDSTLENGCIHFVPGSQKWNLLPKGALLEDMDAIKERLNPEQLEQFRPEPMILKAGECSFHHCLTLHGSYGNPSDSPRRGVVLNYKHPESRSGDGKHPLLAQTPIIPKGVIIEGPDFPIVYDADAPVHAQA